LRQEIQENSLRERDFNNLKIVISELERKSKQLEQLLQDTKDEYEDRLEQQSRAVDHYK